MSSPNDVAERFLTELMTDLKPHMPPSRNVGGVSIDYNQHVIDLAALSQTNCRNLTLLFSVHRAFIDLARTSGAASFYEEHQTASVMGHLATNLRWYASEFRRALGRRALRTWAPSLKWAFVTKPHERRIGADFGIVIPSPGRGPDVVRFVLVQAKHENRSGGFDLSYVPKSSQADGGDPAQKLWAAIDSQNLGAEPTAPFLQLHKFISFEHILRTEENQNRTACIYGVYRRPRDKKIGLASYYPALNLAAGFRRLMTGYSLSAHPLPFPPLATALSEMMIRPESDMGFDMDRATFATHFPKICETLPGINMMLVDPSRELILQIKAAMVREFATRQSDERLEMTPDMLGQANMPVTMQSKQATEDFETQNDLGNELKANNPDLGF